ncbi:hypothetical protein ACJJTC_013812 [Scirpophaga incertulas]
MCRGVARAARIAYIAAFPNRMQPSARNFQEVHRRFSNVGLGLAREHRQQADVIDTSIEEAVLNDVFADPTTSTRRLAARHVTNEALSSSMLKFLHQKKILSTSDPAVSDGQMSEDKSYPEEVMQSIISNKSINDSEHCARSSFDPGEGSSFDLGQAASSFNVMENAESELCKLETNNPGKWSFSISDAYRHDLVQCGPRQYLHLNNECYPKNEHGRHFSNFYFTRKLSNGENQHRRWLIYSTSQIKVYCCSCKLFSSLQTQMVLGCNDWKHLKTTLERQENQKEHRKSMVLWLEYEKGIT